MSASSNGRGLWILGKKKFRFRGIRDCRQIYGESIEKICEIAGITRDAYYKHWKREKVKEEREARILEKVHDIRQEQPRLGTKKLHVMIQEDVKIGRDKLHAVLNENGMMVKRRKKYTRTTYSNHEYAVAPNLVKELIVTRPDQVWVGDITYLETKDRHAYLFLVTDKYSRKIVGYKLGDSLEHRHAIDALREAVKSKRGEGETIFHSDRGCQYCCHEYRKVLRQYRIKSSMTDENHCYQNGVAERVNGILKDEYYLDIRFNSFEEAERTVKQAIELYNIKRPHRSLNMATPMVVYNMAA